MGTGLHKRLSCQRKSRLFNWRVFLILSMVFLSGTLLARPTSATVDFNVSLDPVLQVVIPADTILLDLTPTASGADFTSSDLNVAIGTNNPTGYHFSLHTNSTNLTKTEADNYGNYAILPTLEDNSIGYNETDFTVNRWGYLVNNLTKGEDSELYLPFETDIELSVTTGPVDIEEFGFRFGAKVDMEQPAGTYVLALNFNAVANVVPGVYTINFEGNGADGGSTASQQIEAGQSANLNMNGFTRTDYNFVGWNTDPDGNGTSYSDGALYTAALTADNTTVTLYAQWALAMQAVTSAQCTTAPTKVVDIRDNTEYLIAKLADGNCWMLQNLKLGSKADTYTLTAANSDTNGNFTFDGKKVDGQMPYGTNNGFDYTYDANAYYCTENYGCYYNWYTATAGEGTSADTTQGTNIDYSICPKGWTLPTGGSGGQFEALNTAYGNSAAALLVDPTTLTENTNGDKPGLLLGGRYSNNGAGYVGTNGYYWSRTVYSGQSGYYLLLNTSSVSPSRSGVKYHGFSVRCVAKP